MASIKRHIVLGGLLASALAIPSFASADDATPVATPTPLAWYQKITVGGYVDAYYQLNLNEASSTTALGNRAYNAQVNQFTYGGGELTLKQNDASSGTGYFVDLLLGGINSAYDAAAAEDNLGVDLGQAYITQAFGNATFTLGKFATPIGYESTYLPSDANFSRSLLYQAEPTFQTGLEASYALPAGFTASLWVDNGLDNNNGASLDNAVDNGKGYGAQVGYTGIKNLSLTGTYYYADNFATTNNNNGVPGLSNVEETNGVVSYTVSDSLSVAGEYLDQVLTGNEAADSLTADPYEGNYAQNDGYALYATYSPMANLSVSPRFTQWFEPNFGEGAGASGYVYTPNPNNTPTPYQLDDYTLTLKYQMGPVAHTLEYEATASNLKQYPGGAGNSGSNFSKPTDVQQTLTYAAIYSF